MKAAFKPVRKVLTILLLMFFVAVTVALPAVAFNGALWVNPNNPRYFTDNSGKAIYLSGSHHWNNLQDSAPVGSPSKIFDYGSYVNLMQSLHQNFMRMWMWEGYCNTNPPSYYELLPWARSSTPGALDGKNKFDLTKLNEAYFERMRSRVIDAGNRGIYVGVMLFQGWSLGKYAWPGHPFNSHNNINGINGDLSADGKGYGAHTLKNPQIVALQESYIKKVIDTVNDLDNVLYEISNEEPSIKSVSWQYHMIDFIHNYEKTKAKQHPVGMTGDYLIPNSDLYRSNADWISPDDNPGNYATNPAVGDGRKVVLADTDHLGTDAYIPRDINWVWKTFLRGNNAVLMDNLSSPDLPPYRAASGHTVIYAEKMNLNAMLPSSSSADCSTTCCLRNPGQEYLVYQPNSGAFTVNLAAGNYAYEWFNPTTGAVAATGTVTQSAAGNKSFTPPFSGQAVLYLKESAEDLEKGL